MLSVLLLSTREIGELPLVVWLSLDRAARKRRKDHPQANRPGKLATSLQFAAVTAALFHWTGTPLLVGATAVVGVVAAIAYWRWALALHRRPRRIRAADRKQTRGQGPFPETAQESGGAPGLIVQKARPRRVSVAPRRRRPRGGRSACIRTQRPHFCLPKKTTQPRRSGIR